MERAWTTRDTLAIKRIGSVEPSPDGTQAVFTVTLAEMTAERNCYQTQIYLADAKDCQLKLLSLGETASFNPYWSPDGKTIAYQSRNQLWLLHLPDGKLQQVTSVPTAVSSFKWSPDGAMIAYTALDASAPGDIQPDREDGLPHLVGQITRKQRLYMVSLAEVADGPSRGRVLTGNDLHVGSPEFPEAFDWSPDSRRLVFSHARSFRPNDWPSTRLACLNLADGRILPIGTDRNVVFDPHFSPDGLWIACKVYDEPAWEWSSVVHLIPVDGGPERILAETPDRRPDLLGWSADGKWIYCLETFCTRERLYALPTDGKPPVVIFDPEGCIENARLNWTRSTLGFSFQTPTYPPEASLASLENISPIQISQLNAEFKQPPQGSTEVIRWRSTDGLEIDGLLTTPPGYKSGQRCPLLVSVHGGPAVAWRQFFTGLQSFYGPLAAFAARGYAALRCNVRGSTGYGKTFRRGNFRDWGGKDVQDLLSGVDCVIDMGVADPERLGIIGWSYGGFLAASTLTQTQRFRAAVIGAGMADLVSYAMGNDSPDFLPSHFGGELWEVANLLLERSPVVHAERVNTPTLILHGEQDQRVPIWQAYEFYNALSRCGCLTQMVVYPRCGHVPTDPKLLLDIMDRMLEWMEQHLK